MNYGVVGRVSYVMVIIILTLTNYLNHLGTAEMV